MSMSTRLHGRAHNFIQAGNMQDARRILLKLLALEPDNAALWQSYQATNPTIGEYQVVLRSLARRYPDNPQITRRIAHLQNQKTREEERETAVRPRKFMLPFALTTVILVLCLVSAFFWLVLEPIRADLQQLQSKHTILLTEYEELEKRHNDLESDYTTLAENLEQKEIEYASSISEYNDLLGKYNQLIHDNEQLQQDLEILQASYQDLNTRFTTQENEYNQLKITHQNLEAQYITLQNDYAELSRKYEILASQAIEPPYIYVRGREVHLAFIRTNGELVRWHVPFEDLEESIRRGYRSRDNLFNAIFGGITLNNGEGEQFYVVDLRTFVDAEPFRTVVPELYFASANNDAFIYEIWNIATQLTSYSQEMQETPRYPLETLLAGGGDCEDTAILVASMLKAAPVNWDINLVYMDLYNPGQPDTVNHVIVHVDTGTQDYFIETTNSWDMQPNRYVNGWYYSVGNSNSGISSDE